jgi:hypothetical protein
MGADSYHPSNQLQTIAVEVQLLIGPYQPALAETFLLFSGTSLDRELSAPVLLRATENRVQGIVGEGSVRFSV